MLRKKNDFVIDNNYFRVLTSYMQYILVTLVVTDLCWPVVAYLIITFMSLHTIFSADLLDYILWNNRLILNCFIAIVFQARCFRAEGLNFSEYTLNKSPSTLSFSKFLLIQLILYFLLFGIFYHIAPPTHTLKIPEDESAQLYQLIEEHGLMLFMQTKTFVFALTLSTFEAYLTL